MALCSAKKIVHKTKMKNMKVKLLNDIRTRWYSSGGALLLLAILLMLPKQALALSGSGTSADPYLIATADDWNSFTKMANEYATKGICGKLTADINLGNGTTDGIIGKKYAYTGTFDGDGHTLTVKYTSNGYTAPFRYIEGATIKNLKTAGTFTVTGNFTAGIVASVSGSKASTIENCQSSVSIIGTNSSQYIGGIVATVGSEASVVIKDCIFSGSINNCSLCGGIIGNIDLNNSATVTNCLVTANFVNSNYKSYTISCTPSKVTVSNSYYLNKLGTANDGSTQVTESQLASGEIAYKLQAGRTDQVWGQKIGTDSQPKLSSATADKVYKVDFTVIDDGTTSSCTKYANYGTKLSSLIAGMYSDGYTADTQVTKDMTVTVTTNFAIASADDWTTFATNVSKGYTTLNAKLTADINLGEGTYAGMIGTSSKPYSGTFDGQGHTVTVNYTTYNTNNIFVAPFRYISGATIKNLNTAGTFTVANKCAAGIVGDVSTGASTIENCRSSVKIVSSISGDGTHGGLVAQVHEGGTVSIKDCIFDGSITGSSTKNCGGFIGWVDNAGSTITNSLQAGTFGISRDGFSFTFARHSDNVTYATISNSYYLNALPMANDGATKVTADQLKSGKVAYKLQADRSEQVWGQTVGSDDMPQLTSDEDKHIYNNVYGSENVYDNYVVINENKDNADNIKANNNGRVKVARSFAANTWNTLVLPFSLTTEEVNTAFGSDAQVAYFTNNTENTIELNYDETGANKAIEANTPVLIRTTSAVSDPTFSKHDIVSSTSLQVSGSNGINFVGSYAASYTIQDGEYFISGDKLWKSKGSSTIKSTRAYFTVPAEQQAKLRMVFGDGTATGIEGVKSDESIMKNHLGVVYNLNGQKVADTLDGTTLPKGIYIVNGKKVIVK